MEGSVKRNTCGQKQTEVREKKMIDRVVFAGNIISEKKEKRPGSSFREMNSTYI